MPNPLLAKYSARIKDVYIELKDYRFFHSPYDSEKGDHRFIGRIKVKERIKSMLTDTIIKSGSYLITGYRGMGKTSVVREAIGDYNNEILDKFDKKSIWKHIVVNDNVEIFGNLVLLISFFLFLIFLLNGSSILTHLICLAFIAFINFVIYIFFNILIEKETRKVNQFKLKIIAFIIGSFILGFVIYFILSFKEIEIVNFLKELNFVNYIIYTYFILLLISKYLVLFDQKTIYRYVINSHKVVFFTFMLIMLMLFFYDYKLFIHTGLGKSLLSDKNSYLPIINDHLKGFGDIAKFASCLFLSYCVLSILLFTIDLSNFLLNFVFKKLKYKKRKATSKTYERFEINLSQESLNEIDILKRMTLSLEDYWYSNKHNLSNPQFDRSFYFLWIGISKVISYSKHGSKQPSYNSVLAKIQKLKNRMSGEVTSRKELKVNPNVTTGVKYGLTRLAMPIIDYSNKDEITYQVATAKEIEDELISIFKDIDILRENDEWELPQFAFIIDELDKIGPHNNSNLQDREFSNPTLDSHFSALESSRFRQRQEAVAKLLANLKGFLNVVRAKFFFIGGREMFDADLADIADRDSFYSSIFNDVIYVESFFKDSGGVKNKRKSGGVTQLTEEYLCNILLNDLKEKDYKPVNLEDLYKRVGRSKKPYLLIQNSVEDNKATQPIKDEELKKQAYKVIFTLQNYIIYLAYRSNGTPKKMTALTEQLMVRGPQIRLKDKTDKEYVKFFQDNIVVLHDKKNFESQALNEKLFIKFNFKTQYEIGLTSNIYRPYLIINSRHLKSIGDKLLYSSSFIVDHLLKFHPFGFSWRNLELIPEVVLVNREPTLRSFIEDLMRFYTLSYVRGTISGIFEYRFRSIARKELIYLSKISDLSSAAFNFTLDESLSIKRTYKKKLIELREKYKNYNPIDEDNLFVHSLCFVQTILGDLHFYDKEYDEAVLYYTESIQSLRLPNAISDRRITRHQFIIWLRNQLKLGLTLEKIRAYDSAFSLYRTLILDTKRYLDKIVGSDNDSDKDKDKDKDKGSAFLNKSEDHRTIHLISMPFVAFLAACERARYDGITIDNLIRNYEEFNDMLSVGQDKPDFISDSYRRAFVKADYFNNVGSILFYKNSQFHNLFTKKYKENYSKIKANIPGIDIKSIYEEKRKGDHYPSLIPFYYYWRSLYFLTKHYTSDIQKKIDEGVKDIKSIDLDNYLSICVVLLETEFKDRASSNRTYYIANLLSKLGDSILSSLTKDEFKFPKDEIKFINELEINNSSHSMDISELIGKLNSLFQNKKLFTSESVIYIYQVTAAFYKKAGYNSYYSFQLKKILYLIKDLVEVKINIYNPKNLEELKKTNIIKIININHKLNYSKIELLAQAIFKSSTFVNEVSNRPQILKYREIFGLNTVEGRNEDRYLIYNNINGVSDNREAILIVESIKLKLGKYYLDEFVDSDFRLSKTIISAYGSVNNRYIRMLELKYRSERCYFIMTNVLNLSSFLKANVNGINDVIDLNNKIEIAKTGVSFKYLKKIIGEEIKDMEFNDILSFVITEALFSLRELIKMFKLYDPGYIIGYSFIAASHSRMGDWCNAYDNFILNANEFDGDPDEIKMNFINDIKDSLGSDSLAYLESKNHYESAILYYRKVIQLHTDGKAYRENLHSVFMLEDDYNDNAAHFTIAAERLRLNTSNISEKINMLNEKVVKSKVYMYDSYLNQKSENEMPSENEKISECEKTITILIKIIRKIVIFH